MCARALTALRPKTKPNVLYVTNCNTGLVCWQRRFSEFCSSLPEKSLIEFYLYPDAMLICGAPKFEKNRTDAVLNPLLLVEVLSKSTENYDRGKKFEYYRSLPTFQEYLLIDQERVYVEHYQRLHIGRWHYGILTDLDETIKLQSINLTIPVRRLYEQVDWLRQESTEEEPYGKTH